MTLSAIRACRQGLRSSGDCPRCNTPQTVSHIVLHCPIGAPMREKLLSAYADATKDVPCATRALSSESTIHHLLSNSSYNVMTKGQDVRLRKKVLPILTGCINTLSAALHAENVMQTSTTTLPMTLHAENVQQATSTTTIGRDTQSSLIPPLPRGWQVSLDSAM